MLCNRHLKRLNKAIGEPNRQASNVTALQKFGEWDGKTYFIVTCVPPMPIEGCWCCINESVAKFLVQANSPEHAIARLFLYTTDHSVTATEATAEELLALLSFEGGIYDPQKCF